jgi:cytochrome c oxidase subunit II
MIRRNRAALMLGMLLAGMIVIPGQPTEQAAPEISMTAKKFEFSPDTVRLKKGDRVKLVITALDRDHGIKIEGYQIEKKLPKDEAVSIELTADKAGTFPFKCSTFCGMGHGKMKGQLIVE